MNMFWAILALLAIVAVIVDVVLRARSGCYVGSSCQQDDNTPPGYSDCKPTFDASLSRANWSGLPNQPLQDKLLEDEMFKETKFD